MNIFIRCRAAWAVGVLSLLMNLLLLSSASAAVVVPDDVSLDPLITGLTQPLSVRDAGDGSGRLFIVEQGGLIRIWDGTQLLEQPFLDLTSVTTADVERGLLGLTFHPDYVENGRFFVNFTADGQSGANLGDTVIAEYQVSNDANVADAASQRVVMVITQDRPIHNGGDLKFGPDGYLYIGMGDGGSSEDTCNRSQTISLNDLVVGGECQPNRTTALLGKMLRLDIDNTTPAGINELCGSRPDGSAGYAIPPGNPFAGDDDRCDEIWSYGLRNPFRFSFDRDNGDLWIGDVGFRNWEEIDLEPAGALGGANYGWRECEGFHFRTNPNPDVFCDFPSVFPVVEISREDPADCSVIGGFRYRGPVRSLRGTYVFGDFCSGYVRFAQETSPGQFEFVLTEFRGSWLSGFGEDIDGELYLTNFQVGGGEGEGSVFRFNGNRSDQLFQDGFEVLIAAPAGQ